MKTLSTLLFAFLISIAGVSTSGQTTSPSYPPLKASIRQFAGITVESTLYRAGKKYKLTVLYSGRDRKTKYERSEYYDGNPLDVTWSYMSQFKRAVIQPMSSIGLLTKEIGRIGEAEVRKKYVILSSVPLSAIYNKRAIHKPSGDVYIFTPNYQSKKWIKVGQEKVLGRPCTLYKTEDKRMGGYRYEETVWVEPVHRLILKRIDRSWTPQQTSIPMVSGYEVLSLELPKSLPAGTFDLPTGTTADIGDLFKDIVTPPGIIRNRPPEPHLQAGVDFSIPVPTFGEPKR